MVAVYKAGGKARKTTIRHGADEFGTEDEA